MGTDGALIMSDIMCGGLGAHCFCTLFFFYENKAAVRAAQRANYIYKTFMLNQRDPPFYCGVFECGLLILN